MNTKATLIPAKTETVEVEPAKVILELTVAQAESLRAITGRIGGHPERTRRGHFDAIGEALREAQVRRVAPVYETGIHQSIYFADEAL